MRLHIYIASRCLFGQIACLSIGLISPCSPNSYYDARCGHCSIVLCTAFTHVMLTLWLEPAGIRNVVGMAFQPSTGDFYFSNNGRDDIGNVTYTTSHPDDYIGTAPVQENFGFPYCDM